MSEIDNNASKLQDARLDDDAVWNNNRSAPQRINYNFQRYPPFPGPLPTMDNRTRDSLQAVLSMAPTAIPTPTSWRS